MLALSRKTNESIMIGSDIEISILEIRGDQVKIGIKAPKNVPVFRKEIFLQIEEENKNAIAQEPSRSFSSFKAVFEAQTQESALFILFIVMKL